ncbi:MAG: ABC transporter substrate-binding protein [Oscillospiraceae bacterium]|nr:ABC transporter substrate-binding protein [Oscillospiraceae bacterium]
MKKSLAFFLAVLLMAVFFVPAAGAQVTVEEGYDYTRFAGEDVTLNVYNWGLYISDGTDDSMDVVKEFEELTGIRVNYTTFDTNESLYSKLKSGGGEYDVIIPSDYMIGKMIREDMLEKLDFANIPNYAMIGDAYKTEEYAEYSVPYTWGVVGIVYNTTMVDDPVTSWESLWDPRYTGQILMFNNSRDAYAIASKKLGLSLNPADESEVALATEELKAQKSLVQAYVMDEIFDKMEGGEAALAPYYAGDALIMIEENPDLAFCIPVEGTNFFVDAMCIPKGCKNKEAAEMFINFMCETEIALANTEFIGYSTPQTEAVARLPEELKNSPIMYPSEDVMATTEIFSVLPEELAQAMDKQWSDVRSYDESGSSRYMIPIVLVLTVAVIILILRNRAIKRFRDDY